MHIAEITILVRDYAEAIAFYTDKLGFECIENTDLGEAKRWVRVRPPGGGASILLARATTDAQRSSVGNQTGGRVAMFFETRDFKGEYARLVHRGVRFVRPPTTESYGTVGVFEDLYGNCFDLIERSLSSTWSRDE